MSEFTDFIRNIKHYKFKFINEKLSESIKLTINKLFPKLNIDDINILINLTKFCIDIISNKFNFNKSNNHYYVQWEQNNYRDIRSVVLLLLPFIKNDNLLSILTDLNHIIYSLPVSKDILKYKKNDILAKYFKFSNISISLNNENYNLFIKTDKLIYHIIHQNVIGLLTTLNIMNGKYYINWINIVPINLNNYKSSDLYINTINQINKLTNKFNKLPYISDLINYNGLWFGDIYNVLRIKCYEEMKSIKWYIFPYEISFTERYYLIQELNKSLDLDNILKHNFNNYENLTLDEQVLFHDKMYNIIDTINNIEVIKYCLIYFINNSNTKFNGDIINKFIISNEQDINDDDFNIIDTTKIKNITYNDIKNCVQYITNNHINSFWNYLKLTLELFKKSFFGKLLIYDNKINNNYYYKSLTSDEEYEINLKNIYNIAKSLSHRDLTTWELLSDNYLSLSDNEKLLFFNKIINEDTDNINTWINLKNNLKLQITHTEVDYINIMKIILDNFRIIYVELVFEELIRLGLLNTFVPNINLTDLNQYPSDTTLMKKIRQQNIYSYFNKNKSEWLESYYYLTNTKFKDLKLIKVEKELYNIIELHYFDIIGLNQSWYTFYAMDWIAQINFFKHYLYHQVLFITGAPGQGKTTQMPKILLYALNVINYNNKGKVICTAPRIPPTVDVSSRISSELGVPIYEPSKYTINKLDTNNYYVQFRHQYNSHTNNNILHGNIKIVTDGTLYEEISNNITMFEKNDDKFINKNIYDIIIVDEAHEHGPNMDMILTLARQTCYLNNKIKLVIMSATMDDDEPLYRVFYKNINDMLMYPIKNIYINHPFTYNKFKINPLLMDRRYHISPPGESTQYKVNEFYIEEYVDENDDIQASIKAQNKGYEKIIDICNKTEYGDILFFANGKAEITQALKYLNENLPLGNIALPFYSELHENYKDIISNINTKINTIKNKKENIYLEWGANFIIDNNVPLNIYKRAIIIATNVAEASITLDSLKYVVDNGFAKVNIYDPILNKSVLTVEKISESSRIQRKGRVGRVNDGFVYYMYNKGKRENILTKYKITQENNNLMIINLLYNEELKNKDKDKNKQKYDRLLLSDKYDPHNYDLLTLDIEKFPEDYIITSGLYNIYLNNFKKQDKELYLDFSDKWYYIYNTGQLFDNLLDKKGEFYLIHPFENNISRNILNKIIYYKNNNIKSIPNTEYNNLMLELSTHHMLINVNYYKNSDILYYNDNCIYYKTEIANILIKIINNMSLTLNNALTIFAASAMDYEKPVYELIILLEILNYDITKICDKSISFKKFLSIYQNNKSDIIFLHNIITMFKKDFNDLMIFNIDIKYLNYKCEEIFNIYNIESYNKYLEPELWNKLYNLKNNGLINKDTILSSKIIVNLFINNIDNKKNDIIKWCLNKHINKDVILLFLNKLIKSQLKLISLSGNSTFNNLLNYAKQFNTNFYRQLTDYNIEEKIIRSFMYGYPLQFAYKDTHNNLITSLNENFEVNKNIVSLTKISHDIIFYLNYKLLEDKKIDIEIISEINPKWLSSSFPLLFNLKNLNNDILKSKLKNNFNKQHIVWYDKLVPILQYSYNNIIQ